jgi:signal transduction histidine kinase
VLIITIAVVNRQFLQRLWDPFYHTLSQLSSYSISKKKSIQFKNTDINEFHELNTGVQRLLNRVEKDYNRLKQFTENASHEIQTPLSVIQNQIELLIQDKNLSEAQRKRLGEINKMGGRLSRLNSALLLLTKIENQQFSQQRQVNVTELLQELLAQYRELANAKDVTMSVELEPEVSLKVNPDLVEMLFRNLLSNAVKHNYKGGLINLRLTNKRLTIINTGAEPEQELSKLFNRFQKGSDDSESLGLGLSIVQTVATSSNYEIDYQFADKEHQIIISFNR